jgi:putative glutathione S-transferase
MGLLVNGQWQDQWYPTEKTGGRFVRQDSSFRHWITVDGSSDYPAEAGRYHLYVSLACPWAHRTLIFRKLKGLEESISISIVDPYMGPQGWAFSDYPGCTPDTVNGFDHLHQLYTLVRPDYTGRVTVPVLFDKHTRTIVNNESAEIIRMLNDAFAGSGPDFFPQELEEEMTAVNAEVYDGVNNGVYKVGFATRQAAYEEAFDALFAALDKLEQRLSHRRYLLGERITAADWRLFVTLLRFDAVYFGHFKCNLRRIVDYPNLWDYLRELHQVPGVADTVNMDHIKIHYYRSHKTINPTGIVPKGPLLDFTLPHTRQGLSS